MGEPNWQRIDPRSFVLDLAKVIRQMFIAIVVLVVSMFSGGGSGASTELMFSVLGLIVVVPALVRYFTFAYAIHNGKLLVRSGVFTKNLRTIPLDRIQNINLTRNLLHRVLGLVDLDIETASSAKAEASISALSEEDARILKAKLTGQKPTLQSFVHEERTKKIIYKPSNWELFLAGASENRLAAILASVIGLQFFGTDFWDKLIESRKNDIKSFVEVGGGPWLVIGLAVLGALAFGWIVSIVGTFVRYYGFELLDDDGKLKRKYGLFNQIENVLPIKRIQAVVLSDNFVQRWLGICKLYVSTAGGFGGEKKDGQTAQIQTSPLLTPVLRREAYPDLVRRVLPNADVTMAEIRPVSSKTIWRHVRSSVILGLILAGVSFGASYFWVTLGKFNLSNEQRGLMALAIFVAVLGLGALGGWMFRKFAGWADVHDVIVAQKGWLWRKRVFLPTNKVQAVTISQSPVQRAFGLASVELNSAAPTFHTTEIEDLDFEVASEMAQGIHERSGAGRDSLVDGF